MKRGRSVLCLALCAAQAVSAAVRGSWSGEYEDPGNGFTVEIAQDGTSGTYRTSDGDHGRLDFTFGNQVLFMSDVPPYDVGWLEGECFDSEGRVTRFRWWDDPEAGGRLPSGGPSRDSPGQGRAQRVR